MVHIFVLFPKQEQTRSIRNLLVRNGFEVTAACVTGSQIMQRAESLEDGLIVCGYKFADMVCSELREYLPDGFRMIVLAPQASLEFLDIRGMEYLPMPLKPPLLMKKVRKMSEQCPEEKTAKAETAHERRAGNNRRNEETADEKQPDLRTGSPRVYSAPQYEQRCGTD